MKQFTPPEIAKAFALIGFSALTAIAAAPAKAVVIDFGSLPNNTSFVNVGATYTEDGFTVGANPTLILLGDLSTYYTGSVTMLNNSAGIATLAQVGGGSFTLSSIDIGNLDSRIQSVTFNGLKADNSIVTQVSSTPAGPGFLGTINFSNFTDLVSVSWGTPFGQPAVQFDNINVSAASSTAVPEPFTVLGTLFGAGYGVSLKRKLAKVKQDK